ncbi:hypothetical protein BGZ98_002528, partial [Dissophora globulifera]
MSSLVPSITPSDTGSVPLLNSASPTAAATDGAGGSGLPKVAVIGITIAGVVFIGFISTVLVFRNRTHRRRHKPLNQDDLFDHLPIEPPSVSPLMSGAGYHQHQHHKNHNHHDYNDDDHHGGHHESEPMYHHHGGHHDPNFHHDPSQGQGQAHQGGQNQGLDGQGQAHQGGNGVQHQGISDQGQAHYGQPGQNQGVSGQGGAHQGYDPNFTHHGPSNTGFHHHGPTSGPSTHGAPVQHVPQNPISNTGGAHQIPLPTGQPMSPPGGINIGPPVGPIPPPLHLLTKPKGGRPDSSTQYSMLLPSPTNTNFSTDLGLIDETSIPAQGTMTIGPLPIEPEYHLSPRSSIGSRWGGSAGGGGGGGDGMQEFGYSPQSKQTLLNQARYQDLTSSSFPSSSSSPHTSSRVLPSSPQVATIPSRPTNEIRNPQDRNSVVGKITTTGN